MMMIVDILTWVFRSAFILGAALAFAAAVVWHGRSRGAWRRNPAGLIQMVLVLALGTVYGAVALRILTALPAVRRAAPGMDLAVLAVTAVAVWCTVAALGRFLVLVLTEQRDYRAEKGPSGPFPTMEGKVMSSNGTPNWRKRSYWADLAERIGWTAAEVVVAAISVDQLGLPAWAVMPTTIALAALKGLVARHVGTKGTAAIGG